MYQNIWDGRLIKGSGAAERFLEWDSSSVRLLHAATICKDLEGSLQKPLEYAVSHQKSMIGQLRNSHDDHDPL